MNSRLSEILEEIRELEKNVQTEMKRREEEFRSLQMRPHSPTCRVALWIFFS